MAKRQMVNLVTLFVIRFREEGDDVIKILNTPVPDMFEVRYETADGSTAPEYRGYMSRTRVVDYVRTLVRALPEDVDPFWRLQVSSNLHPSILYEIPDLSDNDNVNTIVNIVDQAVSSHVSRFPPS